MKLSPIDLGIIVLYLVATVVIGIVLTKRAQRSKNEYLLGGNKLPWYMLGLSNASGMFDISGTMWMVTLLFVYGLKSAWIPWLWPMFNQIFLMVFLSMWLRRSNVTTGAEWITTRFGTSGGARLSHTVVVVFAILLGLGFLAYGFIGIGKFIEIFVPWESVASYVPFDVSPEFVPHVYGIAFTSFAVFYSLLGGMLSIVWADFVQYILMAIAAVVIAVLAMQALSAHPLDVPEGWMSPFFGWNLHLDWSSIRPEVNAKIASDGFGVFGAFFMMMLCKGVLVSLAGPAPNYDMQKILATRTPREAALMSGSVSLILMPIRYLMITGFVVLALIYYDQLNLSSGGKIDFEQILPSAISAFVPAGLLGLLLAGLLAAFIGTFAGTLNASQAYIVNDIYLRYIKPGAGQKETRRIFYGAGLLMVCVSIILGLYAKDVNDILQWIVSGLYGSYVAANVLKWYWWRFNGNGFFFGMICGLIPALSFRFLFPGTLDLYTFPLLLLISVAGCIAGTLLSPPVNDDVLMRFYRNVRPWGFWKPVHDKVVALDPSFQRNKDFRRDGFNVVIGTIWQIGLVITPVYLVLMEAIPFTVALGVVMICSLILKKTWYDRLPGKDDSQ